MDYCNSAFNKVASSDGRFPLLEVFGVHPLLVFEGNLDQNGTDDFGILDTWMTSGFRSYRVYTFHKGDCWLSRLRLLPH